MSNWKDTLEKKCKYFQKLYNYKLPPHSYIILHLDGRGFSKYTKLSNFCKPFDSNFINTMNEVTKYLCENVANCKFGYVQSDEITLILYDNEGASDLWFNNRINKICSITASLATAKFITLFPSNEIELLPTFDCKAWAVPTWNDAYSWISFRNIDCIRNSVSMVGQTYFSHKTLLNKNTDEVKLMLASNNHNWENYSVREKFGGFFLKRKIQLRNGDHSYVRNKWTMLPSFPLYGLEGKENFENLWKTID